VQLLAWGFVVLGGGLIVLGIVVVFGNATGAFRTFRYAGFLVMALGGGLLGMGRSSLAMIRLPAGGSTRTGANPGRSAPQATARASASVVRAPATEELPLTPEMQRCLGAIRSRWFLKFRIVTAVLVIYTLIVGGLFLSEEGPVGLRKTFLPLGLGTLIGGIIWLGMIGESMLLSGDLRRSTFLRMTGPIKVERLVYPRGMYQLHVAGRKFNMNSQMVAQLRGLRRGVVESTKRSHHVFEVRDDAGRVAYRHPEYQPQARA
jgi:hypothetical protein